MGPWGNSEALGASAERDTMTLGALGRDKAQRN